MAEKDKKYYWLKLKRDFFKRHDIQIIEDMPNGKDYILFYLKLLCESVDHDGNLRFNEEIPYNEEMLSTITRTNIDTVRSAIKVFSQLQMMEILDDGTIYMSEVQKMLGGETYWAERTRAYRERQKQKCLTSSNESQTCQGKSIDIDKDIEKDTEIDKEEINKKTNIQTSVEVDAIFQRMMEELSLVITPITFATFFQGQLRCLGVRDHRLVLTASSFMAEFIESKHRNDVRGALKIASNGTLLNYEWEEE